MQYTHHNFYSNFTSSLKSRDLDVSKDILLNEISDFIVFDPNKIIGAIKTAGIRIKENPTAEEITDAVVNNIKGNKKLVKTLAFIISEGNELINKSGVDGKGAQLKMIDKVAEGMSSITGDVATGKDTILNQVKTKAASVDGYAGTIMNNDKDNSGVYLMAGLGVLAVFIVWVYFRQQTAIAPISAIDQLPIPTPAPIALPAPAPTITPVI